MDICKKVFKELKEMGCYVEFETKCINLDYDGCRLYLLKTSIFKNNENLLTQDILMHIKHEISSRLVLITGADTINDVRRNKYKEIRLCTKNTRKYL